MLRFLAKGGIKMNVGKVIKLRINPTREQSQQLYDTMVEYARVCNEVSQWVFDNNFTFSHKQLNDTLYRHFRETSCLSAHMVQNTFRTVCARYKTVQTQLKKQPIMYKQSDKLKLLKDTNNHIVHKDIDWLQKPIQFTTPQCDMVRTTEYSFVTGSQEVSLNTIAGRIKVPYSLCSHFVSVFQNWKLGTAKLIYKHNKWYLHISATQEIEDYSVSVTQNIVGIDRGLRFLMVTYDGTNSYFVNGKDIIAKRRHYRTLRQQLQSKNTKSSRRRLRAIGQRENSWMTDINHKLSKTLCDHYGPNTLFVLEDLEGITFDDKSLCCNKDNRANKTSWAHYQLQTFLEYKANLIGSAVITVNPQYTSQRCPVCGKVDKGQRDHGNHEYRCSCGYRSNDDRVGAMNIRELGLKYVTGQRNPKFVKQQVSYLV